MSLRRPAKNQPDNFEFNSSSMEAAKIIISKYPEGKQQSAVMALLYIAQKQNDNWIPLAKGIQLSFCFCAMYNNAITALCCLPSGYLEMIIFAASIEEELNSKLSG